MTLAGVCAATAAHAQALAPEGRQTLSRAAEFAQIAKLPDWSGAWALESEPAPKADHPTLLLTPDYRAKVAALNTAAPAGNKPNACKPRGMPSFMAQQGPLYEFLFAPGRVIVAAGNMETRIIYTDGRAKPADPDLLFDGTAIGHWEGDTLVIETVGILPAAQTLPSLQGTGMLDVNERIHLRGPDVLEDDITLSDPAMFGTPYRYSLRYARHKDWDVIEDICLDIGDNSPAQAIDPHPAPQIAKPAADAAAMPGGSWESIAALPDWFGPWDYDHVPNQGASDKFIPLTPPFAAKLVALRARSKAGKDVPSEVYHCHPRGMPQMMTSATGAVFDFVFVPGRLDIVPENAQIRRIYTDGRGHPADLKRSFNGHSIGHWEGDALVVDTVGIRKDVQMFYGMASGPGTHVVERIHQINPSKLQVDTVLDDPVAFTAPYRYTRTYTRHADWQLEENYCAQNNRDVNPLTGMQNFNLVPPPPGVITH